MRRANFLGRAGLLMMVGTAVLVATVPAQTRTAGGKKVLVELFTSHG